MMTPPSLVWFHHDLRVADNPALTAAVKQGGPVIPVFIWAPAEEGPWAPGAAARWWLHQSLTTLDARLRKRASRIVIRQGNSLDILQSLIRDTGARAVFWNHRYEPSLVERDAAILGTLCAHGLHVAPCQAGVLFEPRATLNKAGNPFQVFTPFWQWCRSRPEPAPPLKSPSFLPTPERWPDSTPLACLALEPTVDWAGGIRATWRPGEEGAHRALRRFLRTAASGYSEHRDRPDEERTSRLSPYLHFGEISPRQAWHAVRTHVRTHAEKHRGAEAYLRQLGWREFAHQLLFHFPHSVDQPLRAAFANFPWRDDTTNLKAWQRGHTGYPLVDAGMRELWATGWMHNRVRLVTASFLVKHLLLPWQAGARWFWETLVDADLANNTLGWQWVAGCGADAAPYFRIFNPVLQGEKFDPRGDYVRRWIPELKHLPAAWIHKPWDAPKAVLAKAGVQFGTNYPEPVVLHHTARIRALAAFAKLKKGHHDES